VADFIAGHEGKNQSYTHHGMRGSPERQLLASVGLIEADTEVLIVMNDEEDKSFGEIADYIEKSL
jgi:hypothetical protein